MKMRKVTNIDVKWQEQSERRFIFLMLLRTQKARETKSTNEKKKNEYKIKSPIVNDKW